MVQSIQKIGELSHRILAAYTSTMMPPQKNVECVETISRVKVWGDDYVKMRELIKNNNPGEGATFFANDFEGDGYTARLEGTIFRTFTKTGDGYCTRREELENIEIDVESCIFYSADGDEIDSDFDAYCI